MFTAAVIIFVLFTSLYALFAAAIIYHLRQYTLPGKHIPHLVMTIFLFLSALFWLFALYFLLKIPS